MKIINILLATFIFAYCVFKAIDNRQESKLGFAYTVGAIGWFVLIINLL